MKLSIYGHAVAWCASLRDALTITTLTTQQDAYTDTQSSSCRFDIPRRTSALFTR
jgi:hypothetical protein